MPDLDEELFGPPPEGDPAPVADSGMDLDEELFGEGTDPSAVADARALAAGAPEAPRPYTQPSNERPWYENLVSDVAKSPGVTFAENAASGALSNTPDEISAGAISGGVETDRDNQGYQGLLSQEYPESPNKYAAGSRFEDERRTLEAEKLARDRGNPTSAVVGQLAGAGLQAAALPEAAVSKALLVAPTAGAMTAANYMGQGSGDLGERFQQAKQTARENPISTAASVALPTAVAGAGQIAGKLAPAARNAQYENRVAAFTTPAQSEAIANNSSMGQDAVRQLGKDVESRGLHKSDKWWENFVPAKAERYYNNADKLVEQAGPAIGRAEDAIVSAGNPAIKTQPLVDDLRASANEVLKRADQRAAGPDAGFRQDLAAGLEKNQTQLPVLGPRPMPEAPKPIPFEGPATPEVAAQEVSPDDWRQFLLRNDDAAPQETAAVPSRGPGQLEPSSADWQKYYNEAADANQPLPPVSSGASPFSEAVADRRFLDKNINYGSKAGYEGAGAQEAARRQAATSLRRATGEGLDAAAASGEIDPKLVQDWQKSNKDFSVASAVRDPALSMMQKDYGGTLGLKDMVGMGALSAAGVPGLVTAPTAAAMKGRWPSFRADLAAKKAAGLEALAKPGSKSLAAGQATLPDPGEEFPASSEEAKQANESVIGQIQEAGNQSWDWISHLLK